ncbi:hypothetical protein ABH994_001665 [Bradyrhizobium yuanmingense]|uniref:phage tail protein n=1 Tax=Bradyrhizobium yuanmingense TaxID=108015 RepID=UPI003515B0EE
MAIFTAIGTAIAGAFFAGSAVAATVIATGLSLAASYALSYAVKALSGKPAQTTDNFGVQGQIAGGGAVPRSFGFGRHVTAGSLVYANTWSNGTQTPNAVLSQVIALSDMPGERLLALWVNGAKVTLPLNAALYSNFGPADLGYQVPEYVKLLDGESSPTPHLFVKYYDGTQTAADGAMVNVSSAARPYTNTRIGTGICYAVVHAVVNDTLWNGIPTFKFELSGIPLYDPSKDSTVGGSGAHRFDQPATWGGDGDGYPVVQAYAILRGISYAGSWLYGLQNTSAARLPVSNWIAQIAKCRASVLGESGPEPTYRTGLQINVDAQPANALEALMTGCQGKISEVGGFYKCHVGAPDSTSFSFTDGDILATESQAFRPFFALADSVNGIQATYPDPSQGWNTATAPAYYRTDLEPRDGNRRLMANPAFDAVPYPEQAQRLQKSAVEEGQRARGHTIVLPPAYWTVEPGDVGEWTSARNGYAAKQFRVDAGTDKANLDVILILTEVDPSDYDWDTATDFTPVTGGSTVSNPPAPQGIAGFDAQPYTLVDDSGIDRRPAILISWDGSQPGVSAVQYEVRRALDASHVTRGRTDRVAAGNLIITQSILPAMAYQVRGAFVPSAPRDMLWSDWIDVTAPDVRLSLADFEAAIKAQVTVVQDYLNDKIDQVEQTIAAIVANQDTRNWIDKRMVRSQLSARSEAAFAAIEEVQIVAVDTQTAFASFSTAATASFGSTTAFVGQTATAIATFDGYAASSYAVTLDVNGYATGFNLINGGSGTSAFTITADKFQIAAPDVAGGAAVPIFTIANVNGVPKIVFRADMYGDGSIAATRINAGELSAITANLGTVTTGKVQSPSGNFVIDATNERIEIWS